MKILDTLTLHKNDLHLEKEIKIYLCGVTVYDDSHIGHARTIIVFDVLRRYLEKKGHNVVLIQNFTDVDDKIIGRAADEKSSALHISSKFIDHYYRDFDALHIKRATMYPQATQHIPDIIVLIDKLIQKGTAYTNKHGVYFAVSKFPKYGKLSKKKIDELQSGARIEIDQDKDCPLDFALWKLSDEKPNWPSPWGLGRPGWHIECSAMSLKYLGSDFDIHGGGRDLIFPHHENEIAQSEACTGKQFAKTWMHVGMVTINGEKMSKSTGNVKSVRHVLNGWGPNVIRLFCLSGHYSKPIDYSEDLLQENLTKWRQLETAYFELVHAKRKTSLLKTQIQHEKAFDAALENDFNTHEALSVFFRLVKEINQMASADMLGPEMAHILMPKLEYFMEVLGLYIAKITDEEIKSINDLIEKRKLLRQCKQYEQADKIRQQISDLNVEILDHTTGSLWVKREKISGL